MSCVVNIWLHEGVVISYLVLVVSHNDAATPFYLVMVVNAFPLPMLVSWKQSNRFKAFNWKHVVRSKFAPPSLLLSAILEFPDHALWCWIIKSSLSLQTIPLVVKRERPMHKSCNTHVVMCCLVWWVVNQVRLFMHWVVQYSVLLTRKIQNGPSRKSL